MVFREQSDSCSLHVFVPSALILSSQPYSSSTVQSFTVHEVYYVLYQPAGCHNVDPPVLAYPSLYSSLFIAIMIIGFSKKGDFMTSWNNCRLEGKVPGCTFRWLVKLLFLS